MHSLRQSRVTASRPDPQPLVDALLAMDEAQAFRLLDDSQALGTSTFVQHLVLPAMREIGLAWERGDATVVQEHLATQLVRSYLDLLRVRPRPDGPHAWLACPPRELHDLPLAAFALLLQERGWYVRFFGANTPLHDLRRSVRVHRPELVVVSADDPEKLRASAVPLGLLAGETALALGGRAARTVGRTLPGIVLPTDMVEAADLVTRDLADQPLATGA